MLVVQPTKSGTNMTWTLAMQQRFLSYNIACHAWHMLRSRCLIPYHAACLAQLTCSHNTKNLQQQYNSNSGLQAIAQHCCCACLPVRAVPWWQQHTEPQTLHTLSVKALKLGLWKCCCNACSVAQKEPVTSLESIAASIFCTCLWMAGVQHIAARWKKPSHMALQQQLSTVLAAQRQGNGNADLK